MKKSHLLVVDDNPANRMLPGLLLRKDGCRISTCDSGEEALERLRQDIYTHLLLDISLPRISGLDVCREVRRQPLGHSIRIIAYTAHAMPQEIQEFHEAGFDGVLVKPIRRQDLIEALAIVTTPDPDPS
jgi:two-component system cell cycle response regulator DivK